MALQRQRGRGAGRCWHAPAGDSRPTTTRPVPLRALAPSQTTMSTSPYLMRLCMQPIRELVNRNRVSKAGVAVLPRSDAAVHDSRPAASGPRERARCALSNEVWATSWLHGDAHRGLSTRRGRCKKAAPCGSLGYARHYPCSPGEDCACAARPIHVLTRTHLNFAACARAGERQHLLHLLAGRSATSYYNPGDI